MLYTRLASPVVMCIAKRGRNTRLAWLANPNPNPSRVYRHFLIRTTFIQAVKHHQRYMSTIKNNAHSTVEASAAKQCHVLTGNESSRERIGQRPIGTLALGSELTRLRKGSVLPSVQIGLSQDRSDETKVTKYQTSI